MNESKTVYKIERQSLAEQVYNYIKRLILSGELRGGEKIPEGKIAKLFGISRTPIREALRGLDAYGLVQLKPRSYALVVGLEPHEAEHVAQIRVQLETLAVGLLTECGTEEDFAVLERLALECTQLLAAGDLVGTYEKDSQLHLEMAKRTGNRHLYELVEKIDAKVQLLRLVLHLPIKTATPLLSQHQLLINYMKTRNKDVAVSLMREHIMDPLNYHEVQET